MALTLLKSKRPELVKHVAKDLDLRLAFIDAPKGVDKFYHILGIANEGESFCFCHWGDTGSRNAEHELFGPYTEEEMRGKAAELFQEQTGRDLKAVKPGDRSAPGKFWLQKPLETVEDVLEVHWEYYVDDGVDGKSDGWHPYEEEASEEVEALYQQFLADGCTGRTSKRVVSSGYFSYELQFKAMSQKNTSTRKVRSIRRKQGPRPEPAKKGTVRKVKAMKKTSKVMKTKTTMKAKKAPMKAPMKAMKKVSSIAVGKRARSSVWNGKKLKTKTGLKKEHLKKNKEGKLVTKKMSEAGRKSFANVACWISACKQARKELGITGFVAVKKGTPLYKKAKELYPTAKPHVLKRSK